MIGRSVARGSDAQGTVNSDLAFWGNLAFHGRYDGFRVIDISDPGRPTEIARVDCPGAQGDVVVWDTLLFRAVDRPLTQAGCGGEDTATGVPGFEGIQIFNIRHPAKPRLIATVPVDCGAHTMTLVPGPDRDRLLLYVSSSHPGFFGRSAFGNECHSHHGRIPIVVVPLDRPRDARVARSFAVAGANHCHDIAVHQGVDRAVGACWPRAIVWDISQPLHPKRLATFTVDGVEGWHSASLTWDGQVIVMGWEPGRGREPECEPDDPPVEKSVFFYNLAGTRLGEWTLRRSQTAAENCSIHNYNVVSTLGRRYVLVSGNFQSGTSVVDFSDPTAPREIAFSDPPPLQPPELGGAWSSYWYNGAIYEGDITGGLRIFRPSDPVVPQPITLFHLNPQTQRDLAPYPG
ncbi:MAG TPA: hypothetical protein VHI54_12290 [Actinomycetota bacterium]|nr:hypothetical protein [Actinomycetota bacterium]